MGDLKLYLAELNPNKGSVTYVVEDSHGDQVDRVSLIDESLDGYIPKTMDLFLLSYLPKLMAIGNSLEILGPVSNKLITELDNMQRNLIMSGIHPFSAVTLNISKVSDSVERSYNKNDIIKFAEIYLKNSNLDDTLINVFKHYKKEV